ncbi:helix-turn-helix domain-containing protein, partial [Elusimicrobiota bacterium]
MLVENIKKYRQKMGWSQQKLAEKTGMSYNLITKIEQGAATNPTMETL